MEEYDLYSIICTTNVVTCGKEPQGEELPSQDFGDAVTSETNPWSNGHSSSLQVEG